MLLVTKTDHLMITGGVRGFPTVKQINDTAAELLVPHYDDESGKFPGLTFDCSGTITGITLLAAAPALDHDIDLQLWAPTRVTLPPTEGTKLDDGRDDTSTQTSSSSPTRSTRADSTTTDQQVCKNYHLTPDRIFQLQRVKSSISTMTSAYDVQFNGFDDVNVIRVREKNILVIETQLPLLYQNRGTSQSYSTDQTCLQEDDRDGSPLISVQIGK